MARRAGSNKGQPNITLLVLLFRRRQFSLVIVLYCYSIAFVQAHYIWFYRPRALWSYIRGSDNSLPVLEAVRGLE